MSSLREIPRCLAWLPILVGIAGSACSDEPTAPNAFVAVDLSEPLIEASPRDVGADEGRIAQGIAVAEGNRRLLSLLVAKDGKLVVEEYFRGNSTDSLNDVRSVTKSVLSALTGIALAGGFIESLDQSIADYLEPNIATLTPAARAITIGHLLTMTSGFQWDEIGGDAYADWILSSDHLDHLLNQPVVHQPGTVFEYNSAAVHLLGVVLEAAAGMPLPDFARQYLFAPIGIQMSQWERLSRGHHNGGAGLDLRPRDLVKFGQLFLQRGRSGTNQVVPVTWVEESARPRFGWRIGVGPVRDVTYGYLWWVVIGEPEPAFYAWGYGGQFIYVVPDLRLVLVATTEWRGVSADGGAETFEEAALGVLVGELIPAFR